MRTYSGKAVTKYIVLCTTKVVLISQTNPFEHRGEDSFYESPRLPRSEAFGCIDVEK